MTSSRVQDNSIQIYIYIYLYLTSTQRINWAKFDIVHINEWGVTKILNIFIASQHVFLFCYHLQIYSCPQNFCFVILEQATSMSRVHTLVYFISFCSNNLGRKFIGFYDPEIETIYCNLTKNSILLQSIFLFLFKNEVQNTIPYDIHCFV